MGGVANLGAVPAQASPIDRIRERPPTKATSRWRSQFAPEPARCFKGFHWVNQFHHALMNLLARGAFECPDVKARGPGVIRANIVLALHFGHRIKTTDGDLDFKAFSARPPALNRFKSARIRIPDSFDETALFEVASTDNARVAVDMVTAGKAALLEIYPDPMTKEQAEAWLAEIGL